MLARRAGWVIGVDHPPTLEAIWYFADQINEWIPSDSHAQKSARLSAMSEAVLRDLRAVCISLGDEDDAQVIFETLNGHGAELHATNLVRNFIFMRADRDGADGHTLFETYWTQFEDSFWSQAQRRGRLLKPRLDSFACEATFASCARSSMPCGQAKSSARPAKTGSGVVSAFANIKQCVPAKTWPAIGQKCK